MSNADLIERLRHNPTLDLFAEAADALAAADKRIAELEAERPISHDDWYALCNELIVAERKLAVAVDALKTVVIMPRSAESIRRCTQALAQIGGKECPT